MRVEGGTGRGDGPRYLVVQTSFLGDMVLTTPLLTHLAEVSGRGVDVVCTPSAAPLLANHPAVGDVIVYDKRGVHRGLAGFARVVRQLRARGYAGAAIAQQSVRSGALAAMAGIEHRVGFAAAPGRAFYTARVAPYENVHHADRLFSLGTMLTGRADAPRPRPSLTPGDRERTSVDAILQGAGWAADEPFVALAPGSVWGTKRWPGYAELARLLAPSRIVTVGASADGAIAREIAAAAPGRVIDATGRLSLLASAELIGRARLLVTNDSAPLHLASAMNTPTVAIFGPTVPEFGFGPLAERSTTIGHESLACRPCSRHGPQRCPLGHWRCMREITPDAVAGAVARLAVP